MYTIEEKIMNDSKTDSLFILQEQVQKAADAVRTVVTDRIAYLAGLKEPPGMEQLADIYDRLVNSVDDCRKIMTSVLYHEDDPDTGDLDTCSSFNPACVNTDDLKWFVKNVEVSERENVLKVSLPLLMPHRKSNCRDKYIDALIDIGLMYYVDSKGIKPVPFDKALIAFSHTYDSRNRRFVKDHDNIEVKHCIDRIAQFFITSDKGFDCQLYHRSQMGDECRTDIFIMDHETAKKHLFDVFEWDFGAKKGGRFS